jgi:CRISPR/Cas system-associated exonuclease Cas4 (RecB family)
VSDYGSCPRQVWYREKPPADYTDPAPVDTRRATLGKIVHAAAQIARERLYPWRLYEYEIAIPGLDKPGRIDEYDPVLGEVTDGKTAGEHKWTVYGDGGPPVEAWGQVLIYAYALDMAGYPVRTVRVIAINRDTGSEEHFRAGYDPAEAIAALDELLELATQLDLGVVPPRAGTGPGRFPCSWCPARLHCWQVDAAQAAGRSPESYTLLGAEPDDPTVGWAAAQVYAATKANTAAKNAKDEVSALLEGIPAGTYGEWTIGPRSREVPDYKGSYERLLGLYPLPDEHRPPIEHVEAPLKRTDRWVGVKRERAATRETKPRARAKKAAE